jgi:hypothetical protein
MGIERDTIDGVLGFIAAVDLAKPRRGSQENSPHYVIALEQLDASSIVIAGYPEALPRRHRISHRPGAFPGCDCLQQLAHHGSVCREIVQFR